MVYGRLGTFLLNFHNGLMITIRKTIRNANVNTNSLGEILDAREQHVGVLDHNLELCLSVDVSLQGLLRAALPQQRVALLLQVGGLQHALIETALQRAAGFLQVLIQRDLLLVLDVL